MRELFPTFWQYAPDVGGSTRFSLGVAEVATPEPARDEDGPLESLRCDVMIALSDRLTQASIEHPHLAPFLMDGLDNALERLQLAEDEGDLRPIEQWLSESLELKPKI